MTEPFHEDELVGRTRYGPLPIIAATDAAIRNLPAGITFAFAPYGRDLNRPTTAARRDGHEIMIQVSLEPFRLSRQ